MSWRFLVFTAVMVLLLYAHFYLAHRQWKARRGLETNDIDRNFVLREEYFSESFRALVRTWKDIPDWKVNSDGTRTVTKGSELLRASGPLDLPAHARSEDVLLVDGTIRVGDDSVLSREVHASGDADLGRGCRVQAIASDGDLTMGEGGRAVRWVDSGGRLRLGSGCTIQSRATARAAIEAHTGVRARSLYAPEIRILPTAAPAEAAAAGMDLHRSFEPEDPACLAELGVDPEKLDRLAPDCWVYRQNLRLRVPVALRVTLIVNGDCSIAPQSTVAADLKAAGRLHIGRHSRCLGNLIAGSSLWMDEFSSFNGVMHAQNDVLLARGVRGGTDGKLVAAFAGGRLYAADDVIVRGKLAAGEHVHTVSAKFAEAWKRDHGFTA